MRIPSTQSNKPVPRRALAWFAAALLACAALGCGDKPSLAGGESNDTRKTATLRQQIEEVQGIASAPDVPVLKLEPGFISEELSITGELVPSNSVIVKPLMEGRITFLRPIKVGDQVKKGDLIAKIDDRDIEDEIEYQQKQISISTEKLKLDEQALAQSKKDLEFDRQLVKEGYLNQHEFEKTEMSLKQAMLALSQSQIVLEQDRSKLGKAMRQREKVPIAAPIGGMVVLPSHLTSEEKTFSLLNEEILSLEGMLVGTATPIFGIVSQDGYLAQCQANGRDKAKIQEGQRASVTVITHKPVTVPGKVTKISLLQDAKSHAYKIWIGLDEADKTFTSGLFVRANIQLARHEGVLVVKKEFVKERNNRQLVQIVQGGAVKDRWVTAGLSQEDKVELESGVKAGEMLVASKEVFAAEQAVHPVPVEPEGDGEAQPDLKVLPSQPDAFPLVFTKDRVQMVPLTFKVNDSPTSYTRAMLIMRTSDLRNALKPRITLNPARQLPEPEKTLHEGEEQIMNIPCPLEFLKRGDNTIFIAFDGNYYKFKGGIQVKALELRFYR